MIESGVSLSLIDVLVTPEIAGILLEYNETGVSNRRISKGYLSSQVRALLNDTWENTGEPIIMSDSKLLNDGQHRLTALIQANKSVIMDLRFGVKRHAFAATNAGRKRQGGEALALLGTPNHFAVAAAARMVLCYEDGLPDSIHLTYSNPEVVAAVERWPDITPAMMLLKGAKSLNNGTMGALSYFCLKTGTQKQYEEFWDVLRNGGGRTDAPAHVLREYLYGNKFTQNKTDRLHAFARAILAWNAFRDGVRVGRLRWRMGDPFPTVNDLVL